MQAVARGEVSSCANPLITFAYQANGLLANVASLRFSVDDLTVTPSVVRQGNTIVDVGAGCPAGDRLAIGQYVADINAAGWALGTHEIIWRYIVTVGGPELVVRRRFEVVDEAVWGGGRQYLSYADSARARQLGMAIPAGGSITDIQRELELASRMVEDLTGRFFAPRREVMRFDSKGERSLKLFHPIIGLQEIGVTGISSTDTEIRTTVNLNLVEVYNRHLRGQIDPDDRDDPKITYALEFDPASVIASIEGLRFARGVMNIDVTGIFGYTDPDGTPSGQTPQAIQRVVVLLAQSSLTDPLGQNPASSAGVIKSYRTRDQAISFMTPKDTGTPTGATGDPRVDAVLARYHRPPHFAATGPVM